MAVSMAGDSLEDYSLYSVLSDEELMQLAIERSLHSPSTQTYPTSNPNPTQTYPTSYPNPTQTYPTSNPNPKQTYPTSNPNPTQTYHTSNPNPTQTYPTSNPNPTQTYHTSNPNPTQTYPTSNPNPTQTYHTSNPNPTQTYPTSNPNPTQTYPTSNPNPTQTYPTSNPNPTQTYPTSNPNPMQTYPTSNPNPTQTYPTSNPNPMQTYPTSNPNPTQTYPTSNQMQVNPKVLNLAPFRHVYESDPTSAYNFNRPPTFLCPLVKTDVAPLRALIFRGDSNALLRLVNKNCSSLCQADSDGWVALHEAAYYGQLKCLRILTRAQPNMVDQCSLAGQTPLLLAVARGNKSCVEVLLQGGADPNIANKERETPLFKACERPDINIAKLLLEFGALVSRCCSQGSSPLHEAARHGHMELCSLLLRAGASVHTTNMYGIQPLFTAAQNGHVNVLNFFTEKGADINRQAGDGATPLYEACKNGQAAVVETLLLLNADVNLPTKAGLLPLHVAVQKARTHIISMLLPVTSRPCVWRSGISPLHIAAERNRDNILQLLLEHGFAADAQLSEERSKMYPDHRSTALYFSVANDNLEAAGMLLQAGASPNLDCFHPLLVAVRQGSEDMVRLLLEAGADVHAQVSTHPSTFPSALLLCLDNLPLLKLLLDHGCDAHACFSCTYGGHAHPAFRPHVRQSEEPAVRRCVQFCEAISNPSICNRVGPVISLLLDYVGHIQLCSRLMQNLERQAWQHILWKLCRLKIRLLLGIQRLKSIHRLPLPGILIRYLCYEVKELC